MIMPSGIERTASEHGRCVAPLWLIFPRAFGIFSRIAALLTFFELAASNTPRQFKGASVLIWLCHAGSPLVPSGLLYSVAGYEI